MSQVQHGQRDPASVPEARGRSWSTGALALPGLVIGVFTALHHLTRPALWYDEASSLGAIHDLWGTVRQSGATMAAYYLVLRAWSAVSEDPVWLRSLSLLLALVALVSTVHLARRWMRPGWAAWTGVFLALSYLWGDQAAEARAYPMALLLVIWSWGVLDRLVQAGDECPTDDGPDGAGGTGRPALAYAALWLVLPPTHGLTVLILGAQVGTLVLSRVGRTVWRSVLPGIASGLALTLVLWTAGASGVTNWVQPFSSYGVVRLVLASTGPTELIAAVMGLVIAFGVARAAHDGVTSDRASARFRALAPVLWGLAPITGLIVLSLENPLLVPRYLVFATPGIALLLALGAREAGALVDASRRALAVSVAIGAVLFGLSMAQLAIRDFPDDRWDQAVEVLQHQGHSGDGLLLPERRNRVPLEAAWPSDPTVTLDVLDFPRPFGRVSYVEPETPRADTLAALAGHDRVWLVYQKVFKPSIDDLDRLEQAPELIDHYRLARTWKIDRDIEVRLYERR